MPEAKKNTAYTLSAHLVNATARPSFKANPTLATGDVKVSVDGGSFANLDSLPSVLPAGGINVQVSLTAAEMNGDEINILLIDQTSPKEWDDVVYTIYTTAVGSILDIINIQPLIPMSIDLANIATYRIGFMLINSLDDLPSTVEINPGTISIDRKASGGTTWLPIITDAICSEMAGQVYYDEVFDTATTYAEGDSLRFTLKNQSVTANSNYYEIIGSVGRMFYSEIRQSSVGGTTNNLTKVYTNVPTDAVTSFVRATNPIGSQRINNVLLRCRDSLSDPDGDRHSNERLLRLLDEGQKDLVKRAKLLRTKTEISVTSSIATYQLPVEASVLTRVIGASSAAIDLLGEEEKQVIDIKSHDQMDMVLPAWESAIGDGVEFVVFDKANQGLFKVYPIPAVGDSSVDDVLNSPYGALTDSTDDIVSTYGVVTGLTTNDLQGTSFTSHFGVVTDSEDSITSLLVYYLRKPMTLNDFDAADTTQFLEVSEDYDKALKHYVVGMALRDDKDTQNRQLGNEELGFYGAELALAIASSSEQHTSIVAKAHSSYQAFQ